MHELTFDQLRVTVADSNEALGVAAADAFASAVRSALESRDEIAVILATGNSQLSFANALRSRDDIDWSKISVLHMDEYLGMSEDHPASFRLWMNKNIMPLKPKAFHGVRGDAPSTEAELQRYSDLIRDLKPVVTVMGIGENGHLAFNDPPADFETTEVIHVVDLDDACRLQQVGEGHFASLEETPRQALSLTVHALLEPETVLVLTPELRKAKAVKAALDGPVTPMCPASILTTKANAHLFLDSDSASLVDRDSVDR